ncbi:hypothetical protein SASPL_152889 [Salvia splendens]|uniref:Uncharacterized protein n=1 Tax=Salvia splendens TaxID=180675 RepID=A0A8X8W3U5_SALSN|nr:hypothetical protein SASPL_152889 [Salvia splendens]
MDDSNKKWSARKPPLPVDRLRSHEFMVNSMVRALLLQIEEEHKLKGKWCHNYTKALALYVITKLLSGRPSKKKRKKKPWPDTSFANLSVLHCMARSFVLVVKCALKVEGQWSNEYNEVVIQVEDDSTPESALS